ncbi:MAG: hypothetical protein LBJ00_02605 [Planctomycetaceae bacterium]|nr:hypothetical protein [Planctomycetaceae bacterium]
MNNRFTLLRFRDQLCGILKQLEYRDGMLVENNVKNISRPVWDGVFQFCVFYQHIVPNGTANFYL